MATRTFEITALILLASFHVAPAAQQSADLTPYLIADRSEEEALARSAAPKAISDSATVLVLTRTGFVEVAHGTNGFTCLVARSFLGGFDDPAYWNPKVRAPHCINAPAARSVLAEMRMRAAWTMSGVSKTEIAARTRRAHASHEISTPSTGAMAYMLSPRQYLGDDDPRWKPHLMFYFDRTMPVAAWGAGGFTAPVIDATGGDKNAAVHTMLVPVRQWADGTSAMTTASH